MARPLDVLDHWKQHCSRYLHEMPIKCLTDEIVRSHSQTRFYQKKKKTDSETTVHDAEAKIVLSVNSTEIKIVECQIVR